MFVVFQPVMNDVELYYCWMSVSELRAQLEPVIFPMVLDSNLSDERELPLPFILPRLENFKKLTMGKSWMTRILCYVTGDTFQWVMIAHSKQN
jgi:hypothetical protein